MKMLSLHIVTLACTATALLLGCGAKNDRGTVAVSGTISLNGEPLRDAEVFFMTDQFTGSGKTDESGRYRLTQGAMPGENRILVSKIVGKGDMDFNPDEAMDVEQLKAVGAGDGLPENSLPGGLQETVPAKFSDPKQSTLTFNVPEDGASDVDFQL